MMKRVIALVLIAFCSFKIFSQDLIVTISGDSINCKITKVNPDNIFFVYNRNLEIKSTSLPKLQIKTHQLNYFSRSEIPHDWNSSIGEFKHLQISLDGGFSLEVAKLAENIPDDLKDYYQKLKSGYNLGINMYYYFNETFGIGFKYQGFYSSNKIKNVNFKDLNGQKHFGTLSDNLNISIYGPSFSVRSLYGNGQSSFYSNYYVGYIKYEDDAVMYNPYKITGNTIGIGIEGGYDIELFSNFLIGFQASFLAGGINKIKVDDGHTVQTINLEKGSYESLYRIDFSIGLRFKI